MSENKVFRFTEQDSHKFCDPAIPHEDEPKDEPKDEPPLEVLSPKDAKAYNINSGKKIAFVFNHETFKPLTGLKIRKGTQKDVDAIESTFKSIGFEVEIFEDKNISEIREELAKIEESEDCISIFALFILSHGESNGKVWAHDWSYHFEDDLLKLLTPKFCKKLAGRPKLIFLQACRGNKQDPGHQVCLQGSSSTQTDAEAEKPDCGTKYVIPNYF